MLKKIIFFLLVVLPVIPMEMHWSPSDINEQLRLAVAVGNMEKAQQLLQNQGANPNTGDILGIALRDKDLQMIRLLLAHGADTKPYPDILCVVMSTYELVRKTEGLGKVKADLMIRLINHPNTNLNCVDAAGRTPYLYAVDKKAQRVLDEFAKPEIAKRLDPLLNSPSNVLKKDRKKFEIVDKKLSLIEIIKTNNVLEMQRLLVAGLNPNEKIALEITGVKKTTLLNNAVAVSAVPIIELLLAYQSLDPNVIDDFGATALMLAVQVGNKEIIARLLQDQRIIKGINIETPKKTTALDIANRKSNTPNGQEIVRMLLDKGAHVGSSEATNPVIAKAGRPNVPAQVYAQLGVSSDASAQAILGVPEDATSDAITKAFRRLTTQFHPDRNKGEYAKETFTLIKWAYESLKR